jgi:glycosyltransferase involved in cell wall biosynthesis
MSKTSIIIPARNELYLDKTVDDIVEKAGGEIEIIVMLDACWPNPLPKNYDCLIMVHRGEVHGMRGNINAAARIAKGEYLMKCDAHCMFAEGFDEALKADCEPDWLSIPSRYSMDAEKWERGRGPVDYLYLTFPYGGDDMYGKGLHGKKWTGGNRGHKSFYEKENLCKHILIDDIMAFQGSCWFMHREKFFDIDCLDVEHYPNGMHQEAQELGFKFWLSGGRVIRNKKTWYGHWHKNVSSGYGLSKKAKYESNDYSTDYWMNNRWPKQTRDMKWFIEKFWPIPGWPDDWQDSKWTQTNT